MVGTAGPVVRAALVATVAVALVALGVCALTGHLRAGLALDLGLVIGAANGPMIQRTARLGLAFGALSFGRLVLLSAVGLGLGLLLGIDVLWLVMVGLAAAQLVLAGTAFWRVMTG